MKTIHSMINDQQSVIIKYPCDNDDISTLEKISKNLKYINYKYPYLGQRIIQNHRDLLILEELPGISLNSLEAVDYFLENEWVIYKIVDILKNFELHNYEDFSFGRKCMIFLPPLIRGIYWSRIIIPKVLLVTLRLIFSKMNWIDCHGDFTVYNILINSNDHTIRLIDWESFGIRCKYFDLLMLIYDQCCPISELSWQKKIVEEYIKISNVDDHDYQLINDLSIYIMFIYYSNEVIRRKNFSNEKVKEKYPGKDREYFINREKIRLANLLQIISKNTLSNSISF